MAVRSSMASLIRRVRLLTNDTLPAGSGQFFSDQDIQDVMDETRWDIANLALTPVVTYSGASIQYLDYFSDLSNWEDDVLHKQYRITIVTPSVSENILGNWAFATSIFPPVYVTGKSYDLYRSAADLLERVSARYALNYDFTSDSQSFKRSQVLTNLQALAKSYRLKQRAHAIGVTRSDLNADKESGPHLGPTEIDYMAKG